MYRFSEGENVSGFRGYAYKLLSTYRFLQRKTKSKSGTNCLMIL